ncbi:MAG: hydroxymyristoyl-ACP dehydratase [Pseudomonadota bacterium]
MCLLDEVTHWDGESLTASSRLHHNADHPLRVNARIPTLSAIEYAAQAMAVHGGVSGAIEDRPRAGYLVSLRNVVCASTHLDETEDDLVIEVRRLMGDAALVVYGFSIALGKREVVSGQATVVLDAATNAA